MRNERMVSGFFTVGNKILDSKHQALFGHLKEHFTQTLLTPVLIDTFGGGQLKTSFRLRNTTRIQTCFERSAPLIW